MATPTPIPSLPPANLTQEFQFGTITNMGVLAKGFFPVAFEFAMIALLIYTLVGAFKFLVSGGDKDAVANARKMITHAAIGFFLLIILFLIFQYLPKALGFNFAVF